jgi:hypothetical protein
MSHFLPDFTRWIWLSPEAQAVWELRIAAIARAWAQVEATSVIAGVRDSLLTFPSVEHLPRAVQEAADRGLLLLPLALEGSDITTYSAAAAPYTPGKPGKYRAVVTRPEFAGRWLMAYRENDETAIGKLLGYPPCCTEFYRRVWVQEGRVDTTEAMAVAGTVGPPEANILLRWLSVRLVPHLPCSFNCAQTVQFGREFERLWDEMGFTQELDWAREMLSWPIEWSALHGVAEIRTPILTIMTRTDWTPEERIVRRVGSTYPAEGASGLKFPYRIVRDKATGSPSFKRSVTPLWELNGFATAQAMEQAHRVVLKALGRTQGSTLLDLGCGTGRLLEWAQGKGWRVAGVEADPVRAGAAQVPVSRGDLFDDALWPEAYDVALVMPGRLVEQVDKGKCAHFLQVLRTRVQRVLLYAYGDWLTKYDGLRGLVAAAGFGTVAGDVVHGPQVEAMLIEAADIPADTAAHARILEVRSFHQPAGALAGGPSQEEAE